MKVALIGFSQAGKKSLFQLLTGRDLSAAHAEGQAVEGIARIADERVDELSRICKPKVTRYAENEIVLCPDLPVDGSGRSCLDAARRCDIVCVVIRDFPSESVYHPSGSVDALRDRSALVAELILADLERVETRLARIEKEKRAGQSAAQKLEEQVLLKCQAHLESEANLSGLGLDANELGSVRSLEFLTLKPVLWALNVAEGKVAAEPPHPQTFAVSCAIENEIAAMEDPDERAEFMEDLGLRETGSERLNAAAYDAGGLMSFYTMGPDEVRAWTIRKGTPAPEAAGKIHSDIERGFIRAEIIAYDDLLACGSEAEAKAQGKSQLRGKDYLIADGDICHFLFNV